MKKIALIGCLLMLIGCKSGQSSSATKKEEKKSELVKINLNEVSSLQKKRAYELGKRVLLTCNTSTFKPFTPEEATEEVIKKVNKEKITMTCQNILRVFGQFNDIKLVEVLQTDDKQSTVFRYKCDYEKKYKIKELQVTINQENKATAIITKDWKDEYLP